MSRDIIYWDTVTDPEIIQGIIDNLKQKYGRIG